uniref:Uncharacterized protein n=1 Tax=Myotis myotis TaxID=51298 RepID=A0A7J7T6C4_MYOMY|nr:hypothetical protein mMyoMyo1_009187 [Myotis myotis]
MRGHGGVAQRRTGAGDSARKAENAVLWVSLTPDEQHPQQEPRMCPGAWALLGASLAVLSKWAALLPGWLRYVCFVLVPWASRNGIPDVCCRLRTEVDVVFTLCLPDSTSPCSFAWHGRYVC